MRSTLRAALAGGAEADDCSWGGGYEEECGWCEAKAGLLAPDE